MKNNYKIEDEVVTIEVYSKGKTLEMLIDKEDFHIFSGLDKKIGIGTKGYARAFKKNNKQSEFVQRLILKPSKSMRILHLNGNKLDNRKENLKLVLGGIVKKFKNKCRAEGNLVFVEIVSKGVTHEMVINKEDLEFVSELGGKISLNNYGYAIYQGTENNELVHRALMNCPQGMQIDHINCNRLDNRRENLRIVTQLDNNRNLNNNYKLGKSGIRGVAHINSFPNKPWGVRIRGKSYGYFATIEEASSVANKVYAEFKIQDEKTYPKMQG